MRKEGRKFVCLSLDSSGSREMRCFSRDISGNVSRRELRSTEFTSILEYVGVRDWRTQKCKHKCFWLRDSHALPLTKTLSRKNGSTIGLNGKGSLEHGEGPPLWDPDREWDRDFSEQEEGTGVIGSYSVSSHLSYRAPLGLVKKFKCRSLPSPHRC